MAKIIWKELKEDDPISQNWIYNLKSKSNF